MAKTATKTKKTTEKENKSSKYLVVVESPAKSKTISKMLGSNYDILASYGHIRDFPKKILGFDPETYDPIFEVIPDKKKVVTELNKVAKKADKVFLAPDPDREGEAIAWHISQVLSVPEEKICRIEFNEITKKAITEAVSHPREIDMDRVRAQQTRQILDRVVGYKISPVLWEKLRNYKLSAGRVQSVAVRLICEREAEIEAFTPVEYWSINCDLTKQNSTSVFEAELSKYKDKKIEIPNEEECSKIVAKLSDKATKFEVDKLLTRQTTRNPQPPFITSTLQREASSRLGFGVSKTMQVAQKLYEGIEIGSQGLVGLITYMRTDSTRISDEAQASAKDFIEKKFGTDFYPETPRVYTKKGKNVQDAHEAIRPSYVENTPEKIKQYLTAEQFKLYKLIWERFMASQMASAKVENRTIEIKADDYTLKMGSSKVVFDGFLIVYDDRNPEEQTLSKLPDLKQGDLLNLKKVNPKQHFTQPPPRYSEASLVKVLEEMGIGRPSTYAPIITKIQQRNYVEKVEKALKPTSLGKVVNEQLTKHFTNILDYNFTAKMESKLDEIEEDSKNWKKTLMDFYLPFDEVVQQAKQNMEKLKPIESDKVCPNCGKPMVIRMSRWGKQFYGCSGFPECKTMLSMDESGEPKQAPEPQMVDKKCAKCGAQMSLLQGPYGNYLQCSNDDCKAREKIEIKTGVKCPNDGCDGELVQKKSRYGKIFYACNQYPKCNYALWNEPAGKFCPDCGAMLVKKYLKRGNKIACSNKECKYSEPMPDEDVNE